MSYNDRHHDQSLILGNSIDLSVNHRMCESEIRADVVVLEKQTVRLWGQIKNCKGERVSDVLIKLLKVTKRGCNVSYEGIAHTISDCEGFYQFDISTKEKDACYKVIASKSNDGDELVLRNEGGNCKPCKEECECRPKPECSNCCNRCKEKRECCQRHECEEYEEYEEYEEDDDCGCR